MIYLEFLHLKIVTLISSLNLTLKFAAAKSTHHSLQGNCSNEITGKVNSHVTIAPSSAQPLNSVVRVPTSIHNGTKRLSNSLAISPVSTHSQ